MQVQMSPFSPAVTGQARTKFGKLRTGSLFLLVQSNSSVPYTPYQIDAGPEQLTITNLLKPPSTTLPEPENEKLIREWVTSLNGPSSPGTSVTHSFLPPSRSKSIIKRTCQNIETWRGKKFGRLLERMLLISRQITVPLLEQLGPLQATPIDLASRTLPKGLSPIFLTAVPATTLLAVQARKRGFTQALLRKEAPKQPKRVDFLEMLMRSPHSAPADFKEREY